MAKYEVTYSCGHTETIELYGKEVDRKRRIEWLEKNRKCSECAKKENEERIKKASETLEAEDRKLPELKGSEKQIQWASKLRLNFAADLHQSKELSEKNLKNKIELGFEEEECEADRKKYDKKHAKMEEILYTVDEAHFWIDKRNNINDTNILYYYFEDWKKEHPKAEEAAQEEPMHNESQEKPVENVVMIPENECYPGTVTVDVVEDHVLVRYTMNKDFSELARKYGFRWDSAEGGYKKIAGEMAGTAVDRAAEICNALLIEGFRVSCKEQSVRNLAVSAEFKPEIKNWVSYREKDHSLTIHWSRETDFYKAARTLPGSRWDSMEKVVTVPAQNWREVLDFAEMNSFVVSKGAKEAIEQCKESELKVNAKAPNSVALETGEQKLKKILDSSREVLPDLIDEE